MLKVFTLVFLLLSFGCTSVWSPYKSEFECPLTDNGKCVAVQDAYKESLQKTDEKVSKGKLTDKTAEEADNKSEERVDHQNLYRESLYKELTGLIEEPQTPILAPPKVMRILILPYATNTKELQELYMLRYVFFIADTPKFLLQDPVISYGK